MARARWVSAGSKPLPTSELPAGTTQLTTSWGRGTKITSVLPTILPKPRVGSSNFPRPTTTLSKSLTHFGHKAAVDDNDHHVDDDDQAHDDRHGDVGGGGDGAAAAGGGIGDAGGSGMVMAATAEQEGVKEEGSEWRERRGVDGSGARAPASRCREDERGPGRDVRRAGAMKGPRITVRDREFLAVILLSWQRPQESVFRWRSAGPWGGGPPVLEISSLRRSSVRSRPRCATADLPEFAPRRRSAASGPG